MSISPSPTLYQTQDDDHSIGESYAFSVKGANDCQQKNIQFSSSILLVILAGANINAAIWEMIGLTIVFAGRNSVHRQVWDGPTPDMFVHLKILLFAVFTFAALFKVSKVEDVYRRFRWVFAVAWGFWVLVVVALDALTDGNPKQLAFTRLIPDPATMGVLAGIMTVLLFFRTYRKRLNSSEGGGRGTA